eukprot:gene8999-18633_t
MAIDNQTYETGLVLLTSFKKMQHDSADSTEMYFHFILVKPVSLFSIADCPKISVHKFQSGAHIMSKAVAAPLLFDNSIDITTARNALDYSGAAINNQNTNGDTLLTNASKDGNQDIVVLLLSSNADLNLQNNDGNTALFLAVQNGHLEIATLLMCAGAEKNFRNKDGKTVVDIASTEDMKKLLSEGPVTPAGNNMRRYISQELSFTNNLYHNNNLTANRRNSQSSVHNNDNDNDNDNVDNTRANRRNSTVSVDTVLGDARAAVTESNPHFRRVSRRSSEIQDQVRIKAVTNAMCVEVTESYRVDITVQIVDNTRNAFLDEKKTTYMQILSTYLTTALSNIQISVIHKDNDYIHLKTHVLNLLDFNYANEIKTILSNPRFLTILRNSFPNSSIYHNAEIVRLNSIPDLAVVSHHVKLKKQISELEVQVKDLSESKDKLERHIAQAAELDAVLDKEMEIQHAAVVAAHKSEITRLLQHIQGQVEANKYLTTLISDLTEMRDELMVQNADRTALLAADEEHKRRIQDLEHAVKELVEEKDKLERQIAQAAELDAVLDKEMEVQHAAIVAAHKSEVMRLVQHIQEQVQGNKYLTSLITDLTEMRDTLLEQNSDRSELLAANNEQKMKISDMDHQIKELMESKDKLERQIAQAAELDAVLDKEMEVQHAAILSAHKSEITRLLQHLQEQVEANRYLTGLVTDLTEMRDELLNQKADRTLMTATENDYKKKLIEMEQQLKESLEAKEKFERQMTQAAELSAVIDRERDAKHSAILSSHATEIMQINQLNEQNLKEIQRLTLLVEHNIAEKESVVKETVVLKRKLRASISMNVEQGVTHTFDDNNRGAAEAIYRPLIDELQSQLSDLSKKKELIDARYKDMEAQHVAVVASHHSELTRLTQSLQVQSESTRSLAVEVKELLEVRNELLLKTADRDVLIAADASQKTQIIDLKHQLRDCNAMKTRLEQQVVQMEELNAVVNKEIQVQQAATAAAHKSEITRLVQHIQEQDEANKYLGSLVTDLEEMRDTLLDQNVNRANIIAANNEQKMKITQAAELDAVLDKEMEVQHAAIVAAHKSEVMRLVQHIQEQVQGNKFLTNELQELSKSRNEYIEECDRQDEIIVQLESKIQQLNSTIKSSREENSKNIINLNYFSSFVTLHNLELDVLESMFPTWDSKVLLDFLAFYNNDIVITMNNIQEPEKDQDREGKVSEALLISKRRMSSYFKYSPDDEVRSTTFVPLPSREKYLYSSYNESEPPKSPAERWKACFDLIDVSFESIGVVDHTHTLSGTATAAKASATTMAGHG